VNNQNQDEENGDISLGENFVSQVVNAVLGSPLWPRILLVWLYDEHGGLYDHVPPAAAILPDAIPPKLGSGDVPGAYDIYGPRVPAVAVSGYAKPHSVTNVVHDHTSILATIEAKWNLPAMTYRDANAATMGDFLSNTVTFPQAPSLAAPSNLTQSEQACSTDPLSYTVHPGPSPRPKPRLLVTYMLARHHRGVEVDLRVVGGRLTHLRVELIHGRDVLATAAVAHVGAGPHRLALHRRHHHPLVRGHYTLLVKQGRHVLSRRGLTVR
jgi:phospholipase C